MFEIYLTNAVVLLCVGASAAIYVLYNAIMNGVKKYAQLQTLEALATIAIGAFYLYCSLIWNKPTEQPVLQIPVNAFEEIILNTTNNHISGDKFTLTNENQISYNDNNYDNDNYFTSNDVQSTETNEIETTPITEEYKQNNESIHNQFVFKYQQLLDKIMKQRNKTEPINSTKQADHINKISGTFINNIRVPHRQQRDAFSDQQDACLYRTFLQHAMFISSFIQGVVFLITTSIDCKICQNEETKKRQNGTLQVSVSGKGEQTNVSRKQDVTDKKTEGQTESTIDFTVFVAASELRKEKGEPKASTAATEDIAEQTIQSVDLEKRQNYKQIAVCILINFLAPILCVALLYYSIMGISIINQNYQNDSVIVNHDFMKINSNILDLLDHPINASNLNKANEVGSIINNIYRIIAEHNMTKYSDKMQTHFPPPVMYDILHNLNTGVKQSSKLCNYNNLALKIYMFIVVILGYFITISYMKIMQMQLKKNVITQNFRQNIYGFAAFWFPAVIEMFTRVYITESMPSVVSDLLTLVGNINHLLVNVRNILTSNVLRKSNNLVKPEI